MKIAICSLFVLVCFDTHIAGFSIRVSESRALLCPGTVPAENLCIKKPLSPSIVSYSHAFSCCRFVTTANKPQTCPDRPNTECLIDEWRRISYVLDSNTVYCCNNVFHLCRQTPKCNIPS